MEQLTQEERQRRMLEELAANEAADREYKRKLRRNLILIFGAIAIGLGSYFAFYDPGEPEVYYTDGDIDYVKQADKLRRTSGFKTVNPFRGGYAIVSDGKKCGVVDVKGTVVCPVKYDVIESNYSEHYPDLCEVRLDGKLGLVNKSGQEVLKPIYDDIGPISNGQMQVKEGDKEYFVDTTGKRVAE